MQFAPNRIAQDIEPYHLRFGDGKTDTAVLQHARIAGQRMRAADNAMLHAIGSGQRCKIQAAVELVRLHTN